MRWIHDNMAVIIAIVLQLASIAVYFTGGSRGDISIHVGFAIIGLIFFLIWLGQRSKS